MSGSTPLHGRVISLVLALSIVVGAWLLFEYNTRPLVSVEQAPQASGADKPIASTQQTLRVPQQPNEQLAQPQREAGLTYKCQKNGRISFSDQPCALDALVVSVTANGKLQPVRDETLVRMKRQVAQMEADRLVREKKQSAVIATRATTPGPNKATQCKAVDDWIADLDSQLRQPHGAQRGDYLTGERKKWMDRRFELRC